MSKASLDTFFKQKENGNINNMLVRIYNAIQVRNLIGINPTKESLSEELKIKHQTMTARLSDLCDLGVIEVKSNELNKESTLSRFIVQEDFEKILHNKSKRKLQKLKKWVKKGYDLGFTNEEIIQQVNSIKDV